MTDDAKYEILPGSLFQEEPGYWTAALMVNGVPEYYGLKVADAVEGDTITDAFNRVKREGGEKLL